MTPEVRSAAHPRRAPAAHGQRLHVTPCISVVATPVQHPPHSVFPSTDDATSSEEKSGMASEARPVGIDRLGKIAVFR